MPPAPPTHTSGLLSETRALWTLAWPIVIAQVGVMFMGVVDTVFAGPLGAESLGGLAIGNIAFFAIFVIGAGTLRSLDSWVSQSMGAGRIDDCARGLAQSHWITVLATPPLALLCLAVPRGLEAIGYEPALVTAAETYIVPLVWGLPLALLFAGYRSFLASMNITVPIMVAAALANGLNIGLDWILIDGKFGAPALGVVGIAWSTTACKGVMFLVLAGAVALHPSLRGFPSILRRPDGPLIRRLVGIGLPIGFTIFAEVAAFGGVGVLMGLKGAVPLAAHQVALNVTALLFMVPLGLSTGAAVRCGQALGAGSAEAVHRAGTAALWNGVVYAGLSASVLLALREPVARLYRVTDDVLDLAVVFLGVAALFQLVDCLQVLGNGVLRGLGDTRLPLAFTLLGYGILGIPLGWLGAFKLTDDPIWLWYGLTIGLTIVAWLAILRFRWQVRRLREEAVGVPGRPRPALA